MGRTAVRAGWRGDAVVRGGGVEVAEAVVVFGGEDDVFGAGLFGDARPLVGVEIDGVEGLVEREPPLSLVFGVGVRQWPDQAGVGLGPGAEVDEKSEFGVLPLVKLAGRRMLGEGRGSEKKNQEDDLRF